VLSAMFRIPPYTIQTALIVIAIMLPREFVAIVARDFMKKRERAVEHGTLSLRVLGLGDHAAGVSR